jgi:hypothetical protein
VGFDATPGRRAMDSDSGGLPIIFVEF